MSKFGKSGNTIIDDFILEKKLRWIPYNKFKNVEYLKEGGFGAIYKAIWLKNDGDEKEVILKCHKNLNENLNEFLKEWDYHKNCLNSSVDIVNFYGFTKDPKISKYAVVMAYANNDGERPEIIENTPQCYVDLMKRCWNEDPLKRPSSKEVLEIIGKWISRPNEVNDELKSNIMEFINAPIGQYNNLVTQSHPKAYYTSRLLDFTSKKLNEILESRDLQAYYSSQSTSEKVNEILESEDSQAEDLDDCIVNLKSLDIKTDEN
ncbi:unnamed protein product [Rhizophagus irregularis]|nr:unnamed protein product [Rhizophagus irregularis]